MKRVKSILKHKPKISVIIPVYNREVLLKRAINSLLKQEFTNWEAIIIDDGSSDNTLQVAKKFKEQDIRVKVITEKHKSSSKAINRGLKAASGEFLTLLDSDDEYKPNHLTSRLKRITKQDKPDILYGGFKVIGSHMVLDKRDTTKLISLYNPKVYVGGTFFGKTSVFKKLGGFKNIPYAADSDFLERAILKYKVVKINLPTYIYYRDHSNSVTSNVIKTEYRKQK
jgi:glycosyltransferase involved in cell wall biosynthesis